MFKAKENNVRYYEEIIAGISTFLSMAYLLIVCPQMVAGGNQSLLTSTYVAACIASFCGTIMISLFANIPMAAAPSLALTSLFAVTVMGEWGYSYPQALVIVLLSSILYAALTGIGFKHVISKALPSPVKNAVIAGLGMLLAFSGLKYSGLLVSDENNLVAFGGISGILGNGDEFMRSFASLLAIAGVIVIAILYRYKVPGAILLGVALVGVGYWLLGSYLGQVKIPEVNSINFKELLSDLTGWIGTSLGVCFTKGIIPLFSGLTSVKSIISIIIVVVCFSLNELFNGLSVMYAAGEQAGVGGDKMYKGLLSDAFGGIFGSIFGIPCGLAAESGAGTYQKGKTGIASLVTALLMLAALICSPFMVFINLQIVAPALIFIGVLMMGAAAKIGFGDITDAVPGVITLAVIPFTNSVVIGVALGMISHIIIKLISFKIKDISIPEVIMSALLILYLLAL